MAYLRESFTSWGVSAEASDPLLEDKNKANYDSLFAKWADWCQQRDKNPTAGPVKDWQNYLRKDITTNHPLNSYHSQLFHQSTHKWTGTK